MTSIQEDLIEPIKIYGSGACPICFTPMVVADSEINIIDLDINGNATNIETTVNCRAVCPKCRNNQNMMRLNGKYVPYSETVLLMNLLEIEAEANRRKNEGRYCINTNPLAL